MYLPLLKCRIQGGRYYMKDLKFSVSKIEKMESAQNNFAKFIKFCKREIISAKKKNCRGIHEYTFYMGYDSELKIARELKVSISLQMFTDNEKVFFHIIVQNNINHITTEICLYILDEKYIDDIIQGNKINPDEKILASVKMKFKDKNYKDQYLDIDYSLFENTSKQNPFKYIPETDRFDFKEHIKYSPIGKYIRSIISTIELDEKYFHGKEYHYSSNYSSFPFYNNNWKNDFVDFSNSIKMLQLGKNGKFCMNICKIYDGNFHFDVKSNYIYRIALDTNESDKYRILNQSLYIFNYVYSLDKFELAMNLVNGSINIDEIINAINSIFSE